MMNHQNNNHPVVTGFQITSDFAKKANKRKPGKRKANARKKAPAKPLVPGWLWLLVGLLLGLFIAFLVLLKTGHLGEAVESAKTAPKEPVVAQEPETEAVEEPEPQPPAYQFHEVLTNKEVEIPAEDLKNPALTAPEKYVMPCGSFREVERADTMKAEMALVGIEASIAPVDNANGRWYRVQVGPFNGKRAAERVRHKLQTRNINDCRILPAPKP